MYSFEQEDWYKDQTKRWDELKQRGWITGTPHKRLSMVGLLLYRTPPTSIQYIIYVSKDLSAREIHTTILEYCELMDASWSEKETNVI